MVSLLIGKSEGELNQQIYNGEQAYQAPEQEVAAKIV